MNGPLRSLASLILVFCFGTGAYAQTSSLKKDSKDNFGFGLDFRPIDINVMPGYFGKVENVPLELRQVVSNPDDTWIYGSRRPILTIPGNSLKMGGAGGFNLTLSPELRIYRLRLRIGPNYSLFFPNRSSGNTVREVNQYGSSQRGTGNSLVYYKLEMSPTLKPGWTSEAEFQVYRGWSVATGYSVNYYKLQVDRGYDRYNSFDSLHSDDVSRNKLAKTYGGMGWRNNGNSGRVSTFVFVGKTRTTGNLTEAGRNMVITYKDHYYGSWVVSFHLF